MAAQHKTYARQKNVQKKSSAKSVPPAEQSAAFGQAMRSLFSLAGQMRNMSPQGRGTRIERTVKLLSTRVGELEDSLRAAQQQNEEMMETLVDSITMMDDLGQSELGPELVMGPESLAS